MTYEDDNTQNPFESFAQRPATEITEPSAGDYVQPVSAPLSQVDQKWIDRKTKALETMEQYHKLNDVFSTAFNAAWMKNENDPYGVIEDQMYVLDSLFKSQLYASGFGRSNYRTCEDHFERALKLQNLCRQSYMALQYGRPLKLTEQTDETE